MSRVRIIFSVFFAVCLPSVLLNETEARQTSGTSREPFVLELPGVSLNRYTLPTVRLASSDLPSLKIRVLSPFAEKIKYGDIIVTLNGDGINRECSKTRDTEGKVVTCRRRGENSLGYNILPGKNVLELKASDDDLREYYASYVLIVGDQSVAERGPTQSVAAERFSGRKFGIIVGVSDYKYNDAGLSSLDFADDDAQAIADFLRSKEGGGFLPADLKLIIDRDATLISLRAALADTARRAGPNDLVFIFIAGHGAPDPYATGNLYFLFHDTKVADMQRTAFPMAELKRYLDTQLSARRVFVLIDTCHSAGVNQKTRSLITNRQLSLAGDENNITNFFSKKYLFREEGRAVLTSSDVDEVSRESTKWGNHGVFTWALLQGLRGRADYNRDGLITAGELFQFTRTTVQAETNSQQNPIALPGSSANLTLAVVRK